MIKFSIAGEIPPHLSISPMKIRSIESILNLKKMLNSPMSQAPSLKSRFIFMNTSHALSTLGKIKDFVVFHPAKNLSFAIISRSKL